MLLAGSCEFELTGEFKNDIEKPADAHEGYITLSTEMDSIVIYEQTEFRYEVNSFGLQCNAIQIEYLDQKIINQDNQRGSFFITPDFNHTEWFDLKIDFYLGTGSGSIADKLKAENYAGTKTWKVRFMDLTKYDYKFQHRVNQDGFLELFWVKASFMPYYNSNINYTNTIHPQITKVSGDTTFFVDSTYYGGSSQSFYLSIKLGNNKFYNSTLTPNYPFPELKVKAIGLDSVEVSWTESPLKRYYKLNTNSSWQQYVYAGFKNSFRMALTPGVLEKFYLDIYPFNYKKYIYQYTSVNTSFRIGETASYSFQYSYLKDQFFIPAQNGSSRVEQVDLTTVEGNSYANNGINKKTLWGNQSGTRFVQFYSGDIHIFDDSLNEVKKIATGAPSEQVGGQMTMSNCFGYYHFNQSLYFIHNVGDDASWQQFSFKPYPADENILGSILMSQDGNYVYWRGDKYFIIYDVSNHTDAKNIYQSSATEVYAAMGNPLNVKEVIISKTNKIEVRSVPGFELIKQIDLPEAGNSILINVDTYSNCLLTFSNKYFHVIKLDTMKEIFKFGGTPNGVSPYSARLLRNIFFFNSTKTDLTPYLNLK
jgi:hypothetical protein